MNRQAGTEEAKRQLKKNPKDPRVNLMMAGILLREGNFKDAVRFYQLSTMFSPRMASEAVIDFEDYLSGHMENVPARLALVDFHLSQGNLESAIIELEELVEISPETAQVYNILGRIYLKLGRLDGAISLFEKAMEAGSADPSLLESLAGAYLEKERYADAILLYEKLAKSHPSKRVLRMLSEMYSRLSNYDGAAEKCAQMFSDDPETISETTVKLEELSRLSPASTYVKEQLAEAYIRSLKPDNAVAQLSAVRQLNKDKLDSVITALRKLLLTYPNEREAMVQLADCLTEKGSYSEAVEMLNTVQKLDPSQTDRCMEGYKKVIKLYPKQALAHQFLADCYMFKGMMKEAMCEYENVLWLNPAEGGLIERKCKEILRSDPNLLEACLVLSEALLATGEYRKAATIAEELVQKDGKCAGAFKVLAESYSKIDVLNKSKEAFSSALRLSPYDLDLQRKYKAVCEKDMDKEIAQLRSKIDQDPWRIGLNLDLARLLYSRGSLDAAIRALQNALRDTTRAAQAHNLLGIIFKEQGRFDLARTQFEKSLEFKPEEESDLEKNSRANLGSCMEAQGSPSEAANLYEKIIADDIAYGDLVKRIKYLNLTNPSSVRNKSIALIARKADPSDVMAVWGRDGRRSRSHDDDLFSMSFGQGQNSLGFEDFIKERLKVAEENFILSSQLDSKLVAPVNNLGAVHVKNCEIDKAIAFFQQAVSEDPGNPVFRNNLGVCYVFKKDLDKAEAEFQAALKTDREFNAANLNYGDILLKRDKVKEAAELYKKVGRFDPLFESASRRLMFQA